VFIYSTEIVKSEFVLNVQCVHVKFFFISLLVFFLFKFVMFATEDRFAWENTTHIGLKNSMYGHWPTEDIEVGHVFLGPTNRFMSALDTTNHLEGSKVYSSSVILLTANAFEITTANNAFVPTPGISVKTLMKYTSKSDNACLVVAQDCEIITAKKSSYDELFKKLDAVERLKTYKKDLLIVLGVVKAKKCWCYSGVQKGTSVELGFNIDMQSTSSSINANLIYRNASTQTCTISERKDGIIIKQLGRVFADGFVGFSTSGSSEENKNIKESIVMVDGNLNYE